MYYYMWMLHLSWTQKETNVDVRRLTIIKDLMHTVMKRKLGLFGHTCRMDNSRKIRSVMMGIMDGTGRRGRPNRKWLNDIRDWCQEDIQRLSILALDRQWRKEKTKCALDTYGLSAHGL